MKHSKLKIVVVGPKSTGKTSICNHLADIAETGEVRPTKGVRIVEFFADRSGAGNKTEVELWDCSGDPAYERCWPALRHGANGVVFVYGERSVLQRNTLTNLYHFFVESCDFPTGNCIVLFNAFGETPTGDGNPLEGLNHETIDLETRGSEVRRTFNDFLGNL